MKFFIITFLLLFLGCDKPKVVDLVEYLDAISKNDTTTINFISFGVKCLNNKTKEYIENKYLTEDSLVKYNANEDSIIIKIFNNEFVIIRENSGQYQVYGQSHQQSYNRLYLKLEQDSIIIESLSKRIFNFDKKQAVNELMKNDFEVQRILTLPRAINLYQNLKIGDLTFEIVNLKFGDKIYEDCLKVEDRYSSRLNNGSKIYYWFHLEMGWIQYSLISKYGDTVGILKNLNCTHN